MVRRASSKRADPTAGDARLRAARDFKRDAEDLHASDEENANGVISLIVNSAIAYADALTARYGQFINQQDHKTAVKAMQSALGRRANAQQLERLRRILDEKDTAAYGLRRSTHKRAQDLLEQLDRFTWSPCAACAAGAFSASLAMSLELDSAFAIT